MPIYEYECSACGHQFEEWQKISDPPIRKCPECGKRKVQKLISRNSFHLKGGGWYADAYSSAGSASGKSSSASSSNGTKSKSKSGGSKSSSKSSSASAKS